MKKEADITPEYSELKNGLCKILLEISSGFIGNSAYGFDIKCLDALKLLGEFAGAERCYIFRFDNDNQTMSIISEWCRSGCEPHAASLQNISFGLYPWRTKVILGNDLLFIDDISNLPPEGENEKEILSVQDINSLIAVPIESNGVAVGFIGVDNINTKFNWNKDLLNQLKYAGRIFAKALQQRDSFETNERTNLLFRLLTEKMPDGLIVEDENGHILFINDEFCRLFNITEPPSSLTGRKSSAIEYKIRDIADKPVLFFERLKQLTNDASPVEGEVVKLKSGKILELDYVPLFYKGAFRGHFRKYKDITPIKINEEKALITQARLNEILYSLNTTAYSRVLESDDLTFYNSAVENHNNLSVKSIYTGPPLAGGEVYYDDKGKLADYFSEVLRNGSGEIEYRIKNNEGKIRWLYDRCRIIKKSDNVPVRIDGIISDITDKKLIQLALEESEERYRVVVNNIKEVLFQTDIDGRWTFLNPAWEEITGYSVNEAVGIRFWEFVYAGDKPLALLLFRTLKKSKLISGRHETRYITKSGEVRWVEIFIQLTFDRRRNVTGTFGTLTDITERKTAQAKIELRDKAISAAMNGIVITDPSVPDNPIIYCNPAFEKITGYSFEDVAGKNCRLLQGKETNQSTLNAIRKAVKNEESCSVIIKNYRKDGTPFWNSLSISPIKDEKGRLTNFVGIQSDITERIRAEAALQESEAKFRSVVENVKDVVFQTDSFGNWIYLNPAWEEITGFTIDESLGELFLNYVHPDDRERNQELFEPLINRKKDYCRHIVRYLTKGGGFRYIEVFARLTLDRDNEITGTSGTLNDVTDRMKAEEDIKLALAKEKELNELKSRFISTVSHEFRTPLTSILASTELMMINNEKWSSKKKLMALTRIQDSVEHMNGMITDVLTLNKAETGAAVFRPAEVELINLCNSIVEEVKVTLNDWQKLVFETSHKKITGYFDDKLVRQFLGNLLSNAIKYSPAGGKINFTVKKSYDKVVFMVSDQGVGISKEDQKKLFQPFFRGANISNIPGTGLGLVIMQRAVESHRGKISFESELNKGATFTVEIPLVTSPEAFNKESI